MKIGRIVFLGDGVVVVRGLPDLRRPSFYFSENLFHLSLVRYLILSEMVPSVSLTGRKSETFKRR